MLLDECILNCSSTQPAPPCCRKNEDTIDFGFRRAGDGSVQTSRTNQVGSVQGQVKRRTRPDPTRPDP